MENYNKKNQQAGNKQAGANNAPKAQADKQAVRPTGNHQAGPAKQADSSRGNAPKSNGSGVADATKRYEDNE